MVERDREVRHIGQLERQVALGNVQMYTRHEMQEVVIIDGKARGIIAKNLVSRLKNYAETLKTPFFGACSTTLRSLPSIFTQRGSVNFVIAGMKCATSRG